MKGWRSEIRLETTLSGILELIDVAVVEEDITRLTNNIPALGQPIRDERSADGAQRVLVSISRRRSLLALRYASVLGVHERLKAYYDVARNWLYRKEEIQGCRNETARNACIAQVLGPVLKPLHELARQLKQMETVQWALRSNQECVVAQIRVWTTQVRDS